ncbi:MAG: hypothetical protein ACJAVY_001976 [Marinoscillum sp.]|jgi:hypothetical protein
MKVSYLLLLFLFGCIEALDNLPLETQRVVITGEISNDTTAHTVRVYFNTGYNIPNIYVEDARVKVVDDLGNEVTFNSKGFGIYQTEIKRAFPAGRTYYVSVRLRDGTIYESIPEQMIDHEGSLSNVRYEKLFGDLQLYVDYQDAAEERNYYRWRYGGTYEVYAPIAGLLSEQGIEGSDTISCFNYRDYPPFSELTYCYVKDYDRELLVVSHDLLQNGQLVEKFQVANIPVTRKFQRGYFLFAKQHHISERAYKYWRAIRNQLNNIGSIFETANYNIRGNIRNTEDAEEEVQGFFEMSSVTSLGIFVEDYIGTFIEDDACFPQPPTCPPVRCYDCTFTSPSTSKDKPSYWPK